MQQVLAHPPKSIIQDVIQEGSLAVIAGESGTGKTWLIMDMAVAIASGQPWLGKAVTRSRVGFFDEEMGEWGWYSRLQMIERGRLLQDDRSWDVLVNHFSGIDLLLPDGQNELEYHITSNGLNVAFIDSLSGIHLGNENDTQNMTVVMNSLLRISKRTNCAIVTLHHVKKSDGDYRGSGLIRNKVDNLFMLEEQSNKSVKLWSKKMRYAEDVRLYGRHVWDKYNGDYLLRPLRVEEEEAIAEPPPTKFSQAKEAIESALSHGDKGATHTELKNYIAMHTSVSTATATKAIGIMLENGELKRDDKGVYTLGDGEVSYGKPSKWKIITPKK